MLKGPQIQTCFVTNIGIISDFPIWRGDKALKMALFAVAIHCQPWSTPLFDIAVDGESLDCVSFDLFAKFQAEDNIHTLSTGVKEFCYDVYCIHRIIPKVMCEGGDFTYHNGSGGKKSDEDFILIQVPAPCQWQLLDQTQIVPSFSSVLPRLSGWILSTWSFGRWKRSWALWKPWA